MAATDQSKSPPDVAPCTVLLIEDDPDDTFLFERAFAQSKIPCRIQPVSSVEEGMDYLQGKGFFSDRARFPIPHLIITDLAFRGASGLQFLKWFHYESEMRGIPIICVTGSSDPSKLEQARNFGARCIEKSAMFEEVVDLIREIMSSAQTEAPSLSSSTRTP